MVVHVPQIFSRKDPFPFYGDETFSLVVLALAAITDGSSRLHGISPSSGVDLLIKALSQMGVQIERNDSDALVHGRGRYGLQPPREGLDAGDSGLVLRILTGLLCGQEFESTILAQGQLARRSLVRILEPLGAMGAQIAATYKHTPPLKIFGTRPLKPIQYAFPFPNFSLKISLLLAALYAETPSEIIEPVASISHMECLLSAASIEERESYHIHIQPEELQALSSVMIPFDTDIADGAVVTAALQRQPLTLENSILNPTCGALVHALQEWDILNAEPESRDRIGRITLPSSFSLPDQILFSGERTRRFKSSIPMLAALCAGHNIELQVRDALDIRQQQCDWIAALVDGLASFGAYTEEREDGFLVRGGALHGAGVVCYDDETIALAMIAVAAAVGDDTWLYEVPDTPKVRHCLAGNNIPCETSL